MKKKLGILLFSCLLVLTLTSCDEVLSVVTANKDGEKVITNYISVFDDTVYDEDSSFKSWKDLKIFNEDITLDDLTFKIENKKEEIVVFGDNKAAVELSFFDGGYKYKLFTTAETLNNMFDDLQ